MTALNIRPLPVVEASEPQDFAGDCSFIDERVVRQMILDGEPDTLPPTGNPSLPIARSRQDFYRAYPLAFAG